MGLNLVNLDEVTRPFMLEELDRDVREDSLYYGKYLSDAGKDRYPALLREAIEGGTDDSLAAELAAPGMLRTHHQRKKQSGGFTQAKVPYTANLTLAEGEFNRFFLRGLCQRATGEGEDRRIEIYRARESTNPRSESKGLIGRQLDPAVLLEDLRANTGVDTALGLPPGPNSGLSGRLS